MGKAGFGKRTNLYARILEELKDERAFAWRKVCSEKHLEGIRSRLHGRKYEAIWKRALRKAGTTHIAWVADPELSNADVQNIESDLIETLNPRVNVCHPVPPKSLQEHTRSIVGAFREVIHHEREDRRPRRLKAK